MLEDIQLIYMSVTILKFWSFLYDRNWRRYATLVPCTFLVFTQFYYMFMTNEGIDAIIRNSYMLVLWFNTILRAYILIRDNDKYQRLIEDLEKYYYELQRTNDAYVMNLLSEANSSGKFISQGNLFLGLITCIGFGLYPLFTAERVLPFGSMIPGVDPYNSPFYECWYIFQMIITPMGCCMYIPYTSLIVSFIIFGIVMCKALQHRLRNLKRFPGNSQWVQKEVIECIKYQNMIIEYIKTVNNLTTFIFFLEFIAFGILLCALLFLLIFVDSTAQAIIVYAYITMIFSQILALYWYANELMEQIKVGNIHPITLELFQSLLNASYSYYTLLKRVYG
ncbi:odorant receptor 49b isoform X2 [Haematobia irritans]|uniref:odorant receptor 49b isoform X2 n=1 Tax=Haematobia irritans TaxID=7368 RepID=UPI003F4F7A76